MKFLKKLILYGKSVAWTFMLCCSLSSTIAINYPTRPIRLIVPFPPGGNSDAIARIVGQKLSESLSQSVIIDNRSGAGGNVGSALVANAIPDGQTLLIGVQSALVVNPFLFDKIPFDTVNDFSPISMINTMPLVLVTHPSVNARSVSDLINILKTKSQAITLATPANGAAGHLAGQLFFQMTHTQGVIVPYKGGGPALNDLIAGQVQFMFLGTIAALPNIKTNRIKALATTGIHRLKIMLELPTMAESGVQGFEVDSWLGLLAPAKTPIPVIYKLNHEITSILNQTGTRQFLESQGAEVQPSSPQQYAEKISADLKKWKRVIENSGTTLH